MVKLQVAALVISEFTEPDTGNKVAANTILTLYKLKYRSVAFILAIFLLESFN